MKKLCALVVLAVLWGGCGEDEKPAANGKSSKAEQAEEQRERELEKKVDRTRQEREKAERDVC